MEAHKSPSVFNFYQPDYSPSGLLADAGLVAPEAGLATPPFVIGLLNGLTSLVESGLSKCSYGQSRSQRAFGFGRSCADFKLQLNHPGVDWSDGRLEYVPQESVRCIATRPASHTDTHLVLATICLYSHPPTHPSTHLPLIDQ